MNNSKIIKFCTVSVAVVGIVLNPVAADGNTYASNNSEIQQPNDSGVLQIVNDEQAVFKLNNNVTYKLYNNGVALLINKDTGKSEKLPSEGKDKNGNQVTYLYTEDHNHLILSAMNKDATSTRGAGECITGVAGEGVLGAGSIGAAGAGVGAAGGTIVIPGIGTAAGATGVGAVGAAVGGVGGSLKGASDHCFN